MEYNDKAVNEAEDIEYWAPCVGASSRFVSFAPGENKENVLLVGWGIGPRLTACI